MSIEGLKGIIMFSLINYVMSGFNVVQVVLNMVSNNINNYNVVGYIWQIIILVQVNSMLGVGGWIGNGVYVLGVQCEYDVFIINQLCGV